LRPRLEAFLPGSVAVEVHGSVEACMVRFERVLLERVLLNLAANASEAMPEGGRLSITTAIVEREAGLLPDGSEIGAGTYVRIELADTGTGMDAETLGRVFEPFFSTKEPVRATGMGILAAYGLVRQAGGVIEIASVPDAGTTVCVDLPCSP
jgi:signal transduction histidine kinase